MMHRPQAVVLIETPALFAARPKLRSPTDGATAAGSPALDTLSAPYFDR
jgi:hypothetical protein